MRNEIVVQIAATQNDIYGLTETGKLAKLDTNINKFVIKCDESILTHDKAHTLTKFVSPEEINPESKPKKNKNNEKSQKIRLVLVYSLWIAVFVLTTILLRRWN